MLAGADMTDQPNQGLPSVKRRRLITAAVLRGLVVTTALVVLYYLLPLDRPWDTGTAVRQLIGLLVFTGLTVWQVRAIVGARYPGLRAADALGLIIPLYLLLFASTYFVMERASAVNFTQPLTRTDALYFSVTVFTTVGFGDIAAKSETARVVLIVQMLADLALLGAGARVLLGAVRRGQQRRSGTGDDDPSFTQEADGTRPGPRWIGARWRGRFMGPTARCQETFRSLAMIDEGFVEDEAGLGPALAGTSPLEPQNRGIRI